MILPADNILCRGGLLENEDSSMKSIYNVSGLYRSSTVTAADLSRREVTNYGPGQIEPRCMVRDQFESEPSPELQETLDVLKDPACREIVERTDTLMTADEVAERTEIPLSTTYRKLDRLSETTLVATQTQVRKDGHHQTRYRANIKEVSVWLDENREFDMSLRRPAESPDESLTDIWGELRRGT